MNTAAACLLYLAVALIWLIPDRRIENALAAAEAGGDLDGGSGRP